MEKINNDSSFKGAYGRTKTKTIYLNQFQPEDLRYKICKDIVTMVSIVAYVKKDFYLLPTMDANIHTLTAVGLIQHWYRKVADETSYKKTEFSQPKILEIKDLLACFQIYLFGFVISFTVLLMEIFFIKKNVTLY